MDYKSFIESKQYSKKGLGFDPVFVPDFLFDFQKCLVEWAVRKGKCAIFADCGLGKTPIQLCWAENVFRKTSGQVLILTPLAVSPQTVREGEKFGITCKQTRDGKVYKGINVTNYHRLHYFNPSDFAAVVCDESGILKGVDRVWRKSITKFMSKVPYGLLCTATPAPNDYMELGTSCEALGIMLYNQMLANFFEKAQETNQWTLKGHARTEFWRWCSTWARAVRKPSDLGFSDEKFILPPLVVEQHIIPSKAGEGFLPKMAITLADQRMEKRNTLKERCEKVATILPVKSYCLVWCHLNSESDLLEKIIPGAIQVKGSDKDEEKEERLDAFGRGQIRVLVTKQRIAGFGLNYQHCSVMSMFPTWSAESYYQAVRRCWRFGQTNPVTCHIILTEAEKPVLSGMLRKEQLAVNMYEGITRMMNTEKRAIPESNGEISLELPKFLLTKSKLGLS